jgi:hypothetical protein
MPKGPKGEKRPADVIGAAIMVGRIATGEVEDKKRDAGTEANRKGGLKGGAARAKKLSDAEKKAIAKKAAASRWATRAARARTKS